MVEQKNDSWEYPVLKQRTPFLTKPVRQQLSPGHWNSEDGEEFFNKLTKLLELKSENDLELFVKEVEKKGIRIEIENSG